MGLCEYCAGKLERDMIRQGQWAYSALAFGGPEDKRKNLQPNALFDGNCATESQKMVAPQC